MSEPSPRSRDESARQTGPTSRRFGASMDIRYAERVGSFAAFLDGLGLDHIELRAGYLDVRDPDVEQLRTVAEEYDLTYTVHAPHLDVAPGNVNERVRQGSVDAIRESIDRAAAVGAGGVVVHGGSARTRYPDHVRGHVREQAVRTIREVSRHAGERDVPVCLENQREKDGERRHTATPERLGDFLADVGVDPEVLRVALDVGHAKATGIDHERFVDRFGERIHVVHLHDNDGTGDDHDPLPEFRAVAAGIDAPYNVLEMKSREDVRRCVGADS